MPLSGDARARLVALTPEARAAFGGDHLVMTTLPFRVGRESRRPRRATRALKDRRLRGTSPTNDLYLADAVEPPNVSREHFQIQHNGSRYILVDRQSTCGTIVEGAVIGGNHLGGAVPLNDGDVIIVGRSSSPYVFKVRFG